MNNTGYNPYMGNNSMNNQPQKKSSNALLIIIIVLAAIVLLIGSCCIGYFVIMGNNLMKSPDNPIKSAEQITFSSVSLSDGAIPDIYPQNMPKKDVYGVGTKSSIIERLRANTDVNLNALSSETKDNIKYYKLDNEILRIDIPAGVNSFNYNRNYYFNNGILYFALIYSSAHQSSLYFHNGEMYRWNNEKGEVKYNDFKESTFAALGNFALNEAYSFYDHKEGTKSVR